MGNVRAKGGSSPVKRQIDCSAHVVLRVRALKACRQPSVTSQQSDMPLSHPMHVSPPRWEWHGMGWYGTSASLDLLAAIMKICAHMTGLQERMSGPRYDVFGPWPVCPPHVVAAFP